MIFSFILLFSADLPADPTLYRATLYHPTIKSRVSLHRVPIPASENFIIFYWGQMTKKELREEFNRPSFKQALKRYHGERCVNCGSDDRIEFHHIVPIKYGGTNCITNVVPLCYICHKKAHGSLKVHNPEGKGGRPKKELRDFDNCFKAYRECMIGTSKLKKRLGISKSTHISENRTVKAYLASMGIANMTNNVDMMNSNKMKHSKQKKLLETRIRYLDGTEERINPKWQYNREQSIIEIRPCIG